jgi:hypothetical protein
MPKIQNMPSERTITTKTENKREDSGEEGIFLMIHQESINNKNKEASIGQLQLFMTAMKRQKTSFLRIFGNHIGSLHLLAHWLLKISVARSLSTVEQLSIMDTCYSFHQFLFFVSVLFLKPQLSKRYSSITCLSLALLQ